MRTPILTDRVAVAGTIYGEGALLDIAGRLAIASVLQNRLALPGRFGHSYQAVCLQKSAFSCWWAWGGRDNYERLQVFVHRELGGLPFEGTPPERAAWVHCFSIADVLLAGPIPDTVGGATHYYNPDAMVPKGARPPWALDDSHLTVVVGRRPYAHRFFKGV